MMLAGVHNVAQPQRSTTKRRSSSAPRVVCVTSGWNCTPYQRRASSAMAAIGRSLVVAVTAKPGGTAVTRSPCDIQTSSIAAMARRTLATARSRPSASTARARTRACGRLRSCRRAARPSSACRSRCRECGTPMSNTVCGARGASISVRRFRTARKNDSFRREFRDGFRIVIPRPDFAIDADFANAPRDQLRVLRAEIEDQDLVGMKIWHRSIRSSFRESGNPVTIIFSARAEALGSAFADKTNEIRRNQSSR